MIYYNNLRKEIRILVLGLDMSGKSQLVHYLVGSYNNGGPTIGVKVKGIEYHDINLMIIDFGGLTVYRYFWKDYYECASAIIFMINSSDKERIGEAKECFQELLKDKNLINVPILAFGNFSDIENCLCPDEIIEKLEMNNIRGREWALYSCSTWKGTGIKEGIKWLFEKLSE